MLTAFDLFAGIGGFSYALKDLFKTTLYCEIDTNCCAILNKNMMLKRIGVAPIHPDIASLDHNVVKTLRIDKPDAFFLGFPCTDISQMGSRQFLNGKQSGLLYEVLRLMKELQPNVLFIENVTPFLHHGWELILPILQKAGYSCRWTTMSVADIGGVQNRRRFFCVAQRKNTLKYKLRYRECMDPLKVWSDNKFPIDLRVTNDLGPREWNARIAALSNAVVPQCARFAFIWLTQSNTPRINLLPVRNNATVSHGEGLSNGQIYETRKPPRSLKRDVNVTIYPPVDLPHHCLSPLITSSYVIHLWGTPTRGELHPTRCISRRHKWKLGNQLMYAQGTPHPTARRPNPQFVEVLMGFPIDWTKLV